MNISKLNELKELEKLASQIAKKKAKLEAQLKAEAELAKWYDEVLKESGYKRPRDLVKAMMTHFGIKSISLVAAKRGPGRPRKAAGNKSKPKARRKRTRITAELRDEVKAAVAAGLSRNAASKQFGISYIVIKKIVDGAYDKL